jgi:hypothetical protein
MQAHSRSGSDTRLRAVAVLLTCVLGLTFVTAARAGHGHKPLARGVAVLAVSGADHAHAVARTDQHGDLTSAPATLTTRFRLAATTDSSVPASSRTAQAPQVRGPPAQALA